MGVESSTPKPQNVHEEVIKIINANVQQTAHLEKTADATTILAKIGIIVVIIIAGYIIYRVIINFERMKTEASIKRAVSLAVISVDK